MVKHNKLVKRVSSPYSPGSPSLRRRGHHPVDIPSASTASTWPTDPNTQTPVPPEAHGQPDVALEVEPFQLCPPVTSGIPFEISNLARSLVLKPGRVGACDES